MTGTQQIERALSSGELTLKQLIALAREVRESQSLSAAQQTKLLERISKRIWQRSVCEYDGY